MRRRLGVVLLAAIAVAATGEAQKVEVKTVPPRPDDVATIDGMVKAYYEVVSGPKGQPRDWARDRTLYIKDIRFVPVDVAKDGQITARPVDHQTFAESSAGLEKEGFFEYEIHRVTERYGPIAHVWSTYESKRTMEGPVIQRGINSIELFWDGKRWWIANAIWTDETPQNPIPKEYLPAAK